MMFEGTPPPNLCRYSDFAFFARQQHMDLSFFCQKENVILKMNPCIRKWNRPNIHVPYSCLDIPGLLTIDFWMKLPNKLLKITDMCPKEWFLLVCLRYKERVLK